MLSTNQIATATVYKPIKSLDVLLFVIIPTGRHEWLKLPINVSVVLCVVSPQSRGILYPPHVPPLGPFERPYLLVPVPCSYLTRTVVVLLIRTYYYYCTVVVVHYTQALFATFSYTRTGSDCVYGYITTWFVYYNGIIVVYTTL